MKREGQIEFGRADYWRRRKSISCKSVNNWLPRGEGDKINEEFSVAYIQKLFIACLISEPRIMRLPVY